MATNHLASHNNQHQHHYHPSTRGAHLTGAPKNAQQHHQVAPEQVAAAAAAVAASQSHHKGHQRRQSVARLLPDISKLRLLSWLVEASSELINCDVAIMDGVYAKLNKSQESLLFWSGQQQQHLSSTPTSSKRQMQQPQLQPPPRPSKQPVANQSLARMISEQASSKPSTQGSTSRHRKTKDSRLTAAARRNHHSLPLTNYDASSLAAVSLSPSLGHQPSIASSSLSAQTAPALAAALARHSLQASPPSSVTKQPVINKSCDQAAAARNNQQDSSAAVCDSEREEKEAKEEEGEEEANEHEEVEDDDDGASSQTGASSTTSSSGVQGSLSSSCSDSSGSFSSSASCASSSAGSSSSAASSCSAGEDHHQAKSGAPIEQQLSSAERLSEKIRRTVMEHNHLQNLLVNIIRQHDRLRDQLNQQRRRQLSLDSGLNPHHSSQLLGSWSGQVPKIDLADIADALDDGCSCGCHSRRSAATVAQGSGQSRTLDQAAAAGQPSKSTSAPTNQSRKVGKRASTLPTLLLSSQSTIATNPVLPLTNKVRRFNNKTSKRNSNTLGNSQSGNNNNSEQQAKQNRQEALSQLADKLCENCFETHYWLHGCGTLDLLSLPAPTSRREESSAEHNSNNNSNNSESDHELIGLNNAIVTKRNATFIKLVQQETRSTISKSIELIDLIRREIKSPESIKHKQLMRCFSTSIQLLTSVGNYVVPSQDISAIIPEAGLQQQTQLFSLPSSDFDHLLMANNTANYSLAAALSAGNHQQSSSSSFNQLQPSNYHLAPVPEIPIRRQINLHPRRPAAAAINEPSYQSSTGGGTATSAAATTTATTNLSLINEHQPPKTACSKTTITKDSSQVMSSSSNNTNDNCQASQQQAAGKELAVESSSGASSNNSSASSSIARGAVQQSSITRAHTSSAILVGGSSSASIQTGNSQAKQQQHKATSHDLSLEQFANFTSSSARHSGRHNNHQQTEDDLILPSRPKFWQSSKFNFIKKLLHVKQQRLLRQQSKDRRIYNNKVQNKFRLVMMDLTHFNKSQQLLTTENGVNSLLTSMRNVLEFGLYLTLKLY